MFGSKKDDKQGGAKRKFWPWGRKSEEVTPNVTEAPAEAAVDTAEVPVAEPVVAEQPAVVEKAVEEVVVEQPVETAEITVEPAQEQLTQEQPAAEPVVEAEQPVAVEAVVETVAEPVAPQVVAPAVQPEPVREEPAPEAKAESSGGFFARMKSGLSKTRASLVEGVTTLFIGKKEIDDDLLEELETQLLVSDVGMEATRRIIDGLTKRVAYKELDDADALVNALKDELSKILEPADKPLVIDTSKKPYVILVVGVNGVGKTTTIGKMARQFQMEGKKVMLAAGDTFRAAAVEQLQVWGERNNIPVIAQHTGADSASVLFDALQAAKARDADILIADTAGRLHNKDNLMEELKKVKRVLGKIDPEAPHEVLLVVDAGTGQNALNQARLFDEAVGLTGMALTKLDGTAKGGVTFALSQQMQLPIRFLGVGEQITDLRPFNAKEFVDALFADLDV
ncbi:signal recognition particle-docking protein FtsY [Parendozoicomonas haliclonae]|uniref:Signal recognition particle receptor FtsY n=1 Tax=Parendozoicomonas haliclonae TaxID=1960125 RepID=A0A1X7AL29_9GAMM|nr:signal recognition particle-docking protein FtsY [Parendozoicomonas haliclonae]SMA48583.1 Signal recognition particle receptor FtsY [Parendozoicomonas haliclonae]